MDDLTFAQWPWLNRLFWTLGTIGISYGLGFVINAVVFRRLTALARRTDRGWDDAVIGELRQRIPLWSLLIGLWLSLGYWPIPQRWLSLASNLIKVLGIASVTLAVSAIATRLITIFGPRAVPGAPVSALVRNIVRMLILAVGLLIILNGVGVNITPALAALGVGGLAVALALQEPLANFFAGVFITLAGQIRVGDYLKLDSGQEGYVADFSWRSTRLRMLANNLVIVPNAKLAQAIVVNYHLPAQDLAVLVEVGVDYASDLAHAERVVVEVAREVMEQVHGGIEVVRDYLPTLSAQQWASVGLHPTRGEMTVPQMVQRFEIDHLDGLLAEIRNDDSTVAKLADAVDRRERLSVLDVGFREGLDRRLRCDRRGSRRYREDYGNRGGSAHRRNPWRKRGRCGATFGQPKRCVRPISRQRHL